MFRHLQNLRLELSKSGCEDKALARVMRGRFERLESRDLLSASYLVGSESMAPPIAGVGSAVSEHDGAM